MNESHSALGASPPEFSEKDLQEVLILGTGPAGLTAAIYAARANLLPVCVEGIQPGGQLMITNDVENFPGFPDGVMGPEMMSQFRKQAERFGTRFLQGDIVEAKLADGQPSEVSLADGLTIRTRTLIIATGASAKWLEIPSERKFMGKGVSSCATCDGFFFRNMDIVVVGGGDTAMEEANFLSRFAKSIRVIHRRGSLRASKIMQDRAMRNPKIQFIFDSAIEEILGDGDVSAVRVKNLKTGESSELAVKGVFVAIGHEPNTKLFKTKLNTDPNGYLVTQPGSTRTNLAGVFAAGDVADPVFRQAVTAAGTGCMAAIEAERYLESLEM